MILMILIWISVNGEAFASSFSRVFIYALPEPKGIPYRNPCENKLVDECRDGNCFYLIRETWVEGQPDKEITYQRVPKAQSEHHMNILARDIIDTWVAAKFMTADQARWLLETQDKLHYSRLGFIEFSNGRDRVAIRIYNGSETLSFDWTYQGPLDSAVFLSNGDLQKLEEHFARKKRQALLPAQHEFPHQNLPIRRTSSNKQKTTYVVELGLLDIPPSVLSGGQSILRAVAEYLDLMFFEGSYERGDWKTEPGQRHEHIEILVYALAPTEGRKRLYERHGFQSAQNDEDGQMVITENGMQLLVMDGLKLIEEHLTDRPFPRLRGRKDTWSASAEEKAYRRKRLYQKWKFYLQLYEERHHSRLSEFIYRHFSIGQSQDLLYLIEELAELEHRLGKEHFIDYLMDDPEPLDRLKTLYQQELMVLDMKISY